jgi:hypothetical protein
VAEKPAAPIAKGLAGPGLLAHVCVSKYADHLPLHRLEGILGRFGVKVSRSTMSDWVIACAQALEPVVEALHQGVLASKVIHTDDTPLQVQVDQGIRTGRLWVYVGDEKHPYTLFDYTPTRSCEGPQRVLREFRAQPDSPRYLQADAYVAYDSLYETNGIEETGCWAHTRRYFYNARKAHPTCAHEALALIRRLYGVERAAHDLDATERQALRQQESTPILKQFEDWLSPRMKDSDSRTPLGGALHYTWNLWPSLNRYIEDGDLDIDNNEAERSIRPVAVGRKNWNFAGSHRGGRAAAHLFSLIATATRNAIDPFIYLRDLLGRIRTHPRDRIHELLPPLWHPPG